MLYTIIIPYHSNRNLLDICLSSLYATIPENDIEIIIVANNSNPNELNIEPKDSRCRVLRFNRELLYPKAINEGAAQAKGKYLIFCDADTFHKPDWFENLINAYHSEQDVGYCSSKLISFEDGSIIDFGIGFTPYNAPHPYLGLSQNHPLVRDNFKAQSACAASSMMEKDIFIKIGGFDEALAHSYSDIDMCLKLRDMGMSTLCAADSIVYHKGSSTIGSGMSSALKSDTKGVHMARNGHKIKIDMDTYFKKSADHYRIKYKKFTSAYYVIDFTTIADKQWHYDVIADTTGAELSDIYNKPYSMRDAHHIPLCMELDCNIQSLRYPILYFVDDFRSMRNNEIWSEVRDVCHDLVVDRNANIMPFSSASKALENCPIP